MTVNSLHNMSLKPNHQLPVNARPNETPYLSEQTSNDADQKLFTKVSSNKLFQGSYDARQKFIFLLFCVCRKKNG